MSDPYRTSAAWACPRCGERLIADGPLRTCAGCGGAWLDEPTLDEALRGRASPTRRWLWWRRARLVCPVCQQPLGLVIAGDLHLDRCREHGLWFDAGELTRLIDAGGPLPGDGRGADDVVSSEQLLRVLRSALSRGDLA